MMVWDSVGDGVFDAKPILNIIASKDTHHKEGVASPRGYGAG
jgi:hypothetical protein